MPLPIQAIADDCLAYINRPRLVTTGLIKVDAGQRAWLVRTLNKALEEMRDAAPGLFKQTIGITWGAARTGTVTVTQGSDALTLGTLPLPANGCTIQITGDLGYNEFRTATDGTRKLLYPFTGSSGTVIATAWADSVVLASTVDHVLGAQLLQDRRPLQVLGSRAEWMFLQNVLGYNDYSRVAEPLQQRSPGVPTGVWVETYLEPGSSTIETRVRCSPLPNGVFRVSMEAQIIPTEIADADLDSTARVIPVPGNRAYTILRDLAIYHWSASPWFADAKCRPAINAAYASALQKLRSFRASSAPMLRFEVVY